LASQVIPGKSQWDLSRRNGLRKDYLVHSNPCLDRIGEDSHPDPESIDVSHRDSTQSYSRQVETRDILVVSPD